MQKNLIYFLLTAYLLVAALTFWLMDGTGDTGDGVTHYLFARYAPIHPELYFHHWAKPMFVLLASPFAQLGMRGVHVFNVLNTALTLLLTYRIAVALKLRNPLVVIVIMAFAPFYYIVTFSGLTEPLFALFTAAGIYYAVKERWLLSTLIFSFLPFVRSEGLIIIGVAGFFLLVQRQWKWIPLLMTGHVAYALAGWFVHRDLLWIFTKIPYARMSSIYGKGTWYHFFERMFDVVGLGGYVLLVLGMIAIVWQTVQGKVPRAVQVFAFLGFGGFFVAHSLFWTLGIFNSMGLHRVFIGVMPMIGLIGLYGYNFVVEDLAGGRKALQYGLGGLLLGLVVAFPFIGNPSSIHWQRDFMLDDNQRVLDEQVAAWVKQHKAPDARVRFMPPYLYLAFEIDPFATGLDRNMSKTTADTLRPGDLLIWDNWYAVVELEMSRASLDSNATLRPVFEAAVPNNTPPIAYVVYEKQAASPPLHP